MLPLIAIVTANAFIFGMGIGLFISWIGSSLGTFLLFLIISKFSENEFFDKFRSKKTIDWVDRQGFKLLFIAYACPFAPSCLITVASAFCKKNVANFLPAMMSGKFVMFLVVSYIGSDVVGFFTHPIKIIMFIILVMSSWILGNKISKKLEEESENIN
jgi:uncharacterized membrane protein YdjX (TVP38/TMEM64 family)